MKKLGIVIPVYNEEELISRCLKALSEQTFQNFTLYVVDNNSDDCSVDIVQRWRTELNINIVEERTPGTGCAVDTGMRTAISDGCDVIARTDADAAPFPDWAGKVVEIMHNRKVDVVGGWSYAHPEESTKLEKLALPVATASADIFGKLRKKNRTQNGVKYLTRYRIIQGNNMAVRSSLFLTCGGHPRRPSPTDRLFVNQARQHTTGIKVCPSMKVWVSMRRIQNMGWRGCARWYLDQYDNDIIVR